MTGSQEYKNVYNKRIENLIEDKPKFVKGYANSLTDMLGSSKYAYIADVISFLNHENISDASEVTYDDFIDYMAHIKQKEDGTENTTSYQIAVYSSLKRFSEYLYDSGRIDSNYMKKIKRPKSKESQETKDKRKIGYMTKRETRKYLDCVKTGAGNNIAMAKQKEWRSRDELMVNIFLTTGIRCSALWKLDMGDIDVENMTLKVTDKGDEAREYDLPDSVIRLFLEWKAKREELLNGQHEDAMFISNQRKRMNQSSISRAVSKYAEVVPGKHITPHKLRATYGSQIYNATKDIIFTQECMGHKNSETTKIYIRDKKDTMKKAASIMSSIIG